MPRKNTKSKRPVVRRTSPTSCSAQDRLVICDHAKNCPYINTATLGLDYCSGLKPHLRGFVMNTKCVDGHICRGIFVRCVEVPTPNPGGLGTTHKTEDIA